jgi:hypothetical protein
MAQFLFRVLSAARPPAIAMPKQQLIDFHGNPPRRRPFWGESAGPPGEISAGYDATIS